MTGKPPEYAVGDVVEGHFACSPEMRMRVLVEGRVEDAGVGGPGFHGSAIDYVEGKGWGGWGFDSEITEARRATDKDRLDARVTRRRVETAIDQYLRS